MPGQGDFQLGHVWGCECWESLVGKELDEPLAFPLEEDLAEELWGSSREQSGMRSEWMEVRLEAGGVDSPRGKFDGTEKEGEWAVACEGGRMESKLEYLLI